MKKFLVSALAATMVLTSAIAADAGQPRKKRTGIDPGAAVAAGIIGLAAGAIIAGAANSNNGYRERDEVYLVGYDAYGNPIYRKRPRPQPYYGYTNPGYRYDDGYTRYRPAPRYYEDERVYYNDPPRRRPRPTEVRPEDRLRYVKERDRRRYYNQSCEPYCPKYGGN